MNRYVIGWWNGDSTCMSTWKGSLRQQVVGGRPQLLLQGTFAQIEPDNRRAVFERGADKGVPDSSVTTDVHYICTVTAIPPPAPLQLCHWIRDREESCQVHHGQAAANLCSKPDRPPTQGRSIASCLRRRMRLYIVECTDQRLASSRTALFKTPCVKRTSDSFLKMDMRAAHAWSRLKAACL